MAVVLFLMGGALFIINYFASATGAGIVHMASSFHLTAIEEPSAFGSLIPYLATLFVIAGVLLLLMPFFLRRNER
jgi:hypothetical protein